MSELKTRIKNVSYGVLKVVFGIVLVLGGMRSCIEYFNWSAERNAKVLCDSISIGSDITLVVKKFEKDIGFERKEGGKESVRHHGFPDFGTYKDGHTFMFLGSWMDKAYCHVSLNQDGKVVSKAVSFTYD